MRVLFGRTGQHHVGAWMVGPLGLINALQVARLVPRKDVADIQGRNDFASLVGKGHLLARLEAAGDFGGHGQRNRDRPSVLLPVVLDDGLVEDTIELAGVHRANQRAERSVAKAINARQVGVGDRNLRETGCLGLKLTGLVGCDRAADWLSESAMWINQIGHRQLLSLVSKSETGGEIRSNCGKAGKYRPSTGSSQPADLRDSRVRRAIRHCLERAAGPPRNRGGASGV